MGCLILASIGALVGLFFLIAGGTPGQGWAAFVGLIILGVCAIPWARWFIRKSQDQEVRTLQEQLSQSSPPQSPPAPQQPVSYVSQSGAPSGNVACIRCGMIYPSSAAWCVHCAIPLPEPDMPEEEEEEAYEPPLQQMQSQLPQAERQRGAGLTQTQGGLFIPPDETNE